MADEEKDRDRDAKINQLIADVDELRVKGQTPRKPRSDSANLAGPPAESPGVYIILDILKVLQQIQSASESQQIKQVEAFSRAIEKFGETITAKLEARLAASDANIAELQEQILEGDDEDDDGEDNDIAIRELAATIRTLGEPVLNRFVLPWLDSKLKGGNGIATLAAEPPPATPPQAAAPAEQVSKTPMGFRDDPEVEALENLGETDQDQADEGDDD